MGKSRTMQEIHVVNALPAEAAMDDLFNGNATTDIVNLSNYDKVTWILQKGAGATGSAVITVESCDTVVPGTSTAIAFDYQVCTSGDTFGDTTAATSAGFTTTVGADQVYLVEVNSSELSGTDKYVRMVATESANDPVSGCITCVLSGARFTHEVPQTAIV